MWGRELSHRRARRWIESAFVETLPPARWERLRAHLTGCDACRVRYDRLGDVRRALGGASLLPADAREQIAVALAASRAPRPSSSRAVAGITLAGAAALAALLVLVLGPRPPDDELKPRGAVLKFAGRPPGLRLYCVSVGADGRPVIRAEVAAAAPPLPIPTLRCKIDGELQLAYTSPRLKEMTMIVHGEGAAGTKLWYAPRQPTAPAVALVADAIDEPLPWSTRLAVKHVPGRVDVVARFYEGSEEQAGTPRRPPVYELRAILELAPPGGDR
jgi:hypothetical protein